MSEPTTPPVTPARIAQFAFGYAPPLILEAAIRNRVFDVLDDHPMTVDEVSAATGASTRGLKAIMNALVGLEFLTKDSTGKYALGQEASLFLVTAKPSFQGGLLRHCSTQLMPKWLSLTEIVKTGNPSYAVNRESVGGEFFPELVKDIFPMSYPAAQALGEAIGVAKVDGPFSVLDIATGSGVWGIALAQKSPHVTVTAVDWHEVLPVTAQYVERFGLNERFKLVAGDILEAEFGSGHQVATLGHILHSEGIDRSKKLLSRVYDSLASGGIIAVAEFVPNEDRNGPPMPLIFAVNMLVNTDVGDTFTFNEIKGWLEAVGFSDVRQLDTPGPSPLIVATKP